MLYEVITGLVTWVDPSYSGTYTYAAQPTLADARITSYNVCYTKLLRYRVQEGQAIPVMDPYGAVGTIDASRAAEAFGAGYEVVPDAVYQDARNRAIYGDTGSSYNFV